MKSIELTEEHKSKLLEMCKALFPEYSLKTKLSITGNLLLGNGMDKKFTNRIHWFEFCHEHLSPKVLGDTNLIFCGPNRLHPIDFLYEQFKKLSYVC